MKDLIPQYTVSELVNSIKTVLEGAFYYIKLTGEISSFKLSTSGHIYFNLKDENALINVVMFKNSQDKNILLEDGLSVLIYGRLTIYKDRSNYQIIAEKVEINEKGSLIKIIEERKKKLEAEGLFDSKYKKQIKTPPKSIGIITAKNGAATKDIEVRLKDRLLINNIILYPSLVQGQEADKSIIKGIKYFNEIENVDVIVITRGGGSAEDLMCFNSELLAREVFNSKIPIISAVGHEIDWTIIDYVADLRLPTPTAVAEYLTPLKSVLNEKLDFVFKKILIIAVKIFNTFEKNIDVLWKQIIYTVKQNFLDKKYRYKLLSLKLESFNRNKILKLGYAIVRKNDKIINYNTEIIVDDVIEIELYKKKFKIVVKNLEK